MRIKLGDNFIEHTLVENVLSIIPSGPGGGSFECKPQSKIVLKSGHDFEVAMTPDEVEDAIRNANSTEASPKPIPTSNISDGAVEDITRAVDAAIVEIKKLNEHIHYASEMIARLSMHITDGKPIKVQTDQ